MRLPRCPICSKAVVVQDNEAFPFCSPRCRKIDLGRWLDEKYALPEYKNPEEAEDPDEAEQRAEDDRGDEYEY